MDVDIDIYKRITDKIKNDVYQAKFPFWRFFLLQRNLTYDYVINQYKGHNNHLSCRSGRLRIVITPEGDLYPCEILMQRDKDRFKLGNLRDINYKLKNIYASKQFKETNKYIKDSHCSCHHECDLATNIFFSLPVLLKSLIKSLYWR